MAVERHVVASLAQRVGHAHLRVQVADKRPARDEKPRHQRSSPWGRGPTAPTPVARACRPAGPALVGAQRDRPLTWPTRHASAFAVPSRSSRPLVNREILEQVSGLRRASVTGEVGLQAPRVLPERLDRSSTRSTADANSFRRALARRHADARAGFGDSPGVLGLIPGGRHDDERHARRQGGQHGARAAGRHHDIGARTADRCGAPTARLARSAEWHRVRGCRGRGACPSSQSPARAGTPGLAAPRATGSAASSASSPR